MNTTPTSTARVRHRLQLVAVALVIHACLGLPYYFLTSSDPHSSTLFFACLFYGIWVIAFVRVAKAIPEKVGRQGAIVLLSLFSGGIAFGFLLFAFLGQVDSLSMLPIAFYIGLAIQVLPLAEAWRVTLRWKLENMQ